MTENNRLAIRLNDKEMAKIAQSAATYGLTKSQYLKQVAQKSYLRKPLFDNATQQLIVRELAHQGNNLNQIAKYINANAANNIDIERLNYNFEQIAKGYEKLWQQLQK